MEAYYFLCSGSEHLTNNCSPARFDTDRPSVSISLFSTLYSVVNHLRLTAGLNLTPSILLQPGGKQITCSISNHIDQFPCMDAVWSVQDQGYLFLTFDLKFLWKCQSLFDYTELPWSLLFVYYLNDLKFSNLVIQLVYFLHIHIL